MGIKKELGKKIKRMRINRKLTQEKLAELADISQRALSSIEAGDNFVTAETLDKLLLALNTTTEELFSINHLKSRTDLRKEIDNKLDLLMQDPQKMEIIYKIINALSTE